MYALTQKDLNHLYKINETPLIDIAFYFCTKTLDCSKLLPEDIESDFIEHSYIAGGSVWGKLTNNRSDDIDFFLESQELANRIKEYFSVTLVEMIEEMDRKAQEKATNSGSPFYSSHYISKDNDIIQYTHNNNNYLVTENAVTIMTRENKFQIIYNWYGDAMGVIQNFDLYHCMVGYVKGKIQTPTYKELIFTKQMKVNKDTDRCIFGTLRRIAKYTERGLFIPQSEMTILLKKLEKEGITEKDRNVLEGINY